MILEKFLDDYHEYSGKASDITRQLGYAGLATIWIFKGGPESKPSVPQELFRPGPLIIVGLACDFLQYVVASVIWKSFHALKERRGIKSDENVKAPPWLNKPVVVFFWAKIIFVAIGYHYLLRSMLQNF